MPFIPSSIASNQTAVQPHMTLWCSLSAHIYIFCYSYSLFSYCCIISRSHPSFFFVDFFAFFPLLHCPACSFPPCLQKGTHLITSAFCHTCCCLRKNWVEQHTWQDKKERVFLSKKGKKDYAQHPSSPPMGHVSSVAVAVGSTHGRKSCSLNRSHH